MTPHRHPAAISPHPAQRVTLRMPSGATFHLYYQVPEEEALELARAYVERVGWGATVLEVTSEW